MRPLAALVLAACGGQPVFVPLGVTVSASSENFALFAVVTNKLNPSCASNCEMGPLIEDGGCGLASVVIDPVTNRWREACDGTGGAMLLLQRGYGPSDCDAGTCSNTSRRIAAGATVLMSVQPLDSAAACRAETRMPSAGLSVVVELPDCSFTYR